MDFASLSRGGEVRLKAIARLKSFWQHASENQVGGEEEFASNGLQ
jgi:hypothetical protein